jgi:Cdc6-like AAA superfamily ATPase
MSDKTSYKPLIIVSTSPSPDTHDVPVSSSVTATFSEAVETSTVASAFTLADIGNQVVSGKITRSTDGKTMTFIPSSALNYATSYTATIHAGVKDIRGNSMESPKTWSFVTSVVTGEHQPQRNFSPSVESIVNHFGDKDVTALAIIQKILEQHTEYLRNDIQELPANDVKAMFDALKGRVELVVDIRGFFSGIKRIPTTSSGKETISKIDTSKGEKKTIHGWISQFTNLINTTTILHGRLFIVCLGLVDSDVRKELLYRGTFFNDLERGFTEPIRKNLSEEGVKKYLEYFTRYYSSRTHSDEPSIDDILGRLPFAKVLAIKISEYFTNPEYRETGAFLIHLYGPWGAGKTTVLKFLQKDLIGKKNLVVWFNAWQHQRITPPWWSLLNSVFSQSIGRDSPVGRIRKKWIWISDRRKLSIRTRNWLTVIVLFLAGLGIALITGGIKYESFANAFASGDAFLKFANSQVVGGFMALIVSILTGIRAFGNAILPGSAESAQDLLKTTSDPMAKLNSYFDKLISKIKKPVVIFVDDLDRCTSDYTVEFLEGIQTIFRNGKNVVFVVAADKLWLYESFKKKYSGYSDFDELARPVGYLFLDKIFQMSISLPRLSKENQENYLNYLLALKKPQTPLTSTTLKADAEQKLSESQTSQEIVSAIKDEKDVLKKQALKEAAIDKLTSRGMEKQNEHYLSRFIGFMESNPRSMKRLVNAYSIWMIKTVISEKEVSSSDKLARWVIITLRWPYLADYLERRPDLITVFDKIAKVVYQRGSRKPQSPDQIYGPIELEVAPEIEDEKLKNILLSDSALLDVVTGNKDMKPLDGSSIKELMTL